MRKIDIAALNKRARLMIAEEVLQEEFLLRSEANDPSANVLYQARLLISNKIDDTVPTDDD